VVPFKSFDPQDKTTYKGFFSLKPRFITETQNIEMAALIDEAVKSEKYDVVIASEGNAPSIASLYATKIKGIPKILDAIEIALYMDAYAGQNQPFMRLRRGLTWLKYRRFVKDLLRNSDACTVPSLQEKINFESFAPKNYHIEVIPHSLEINQYKGNFGPIDSQSLVFTGSFSYHANLDAVRFFLQKIFPKIQSHNQGVKLKVIGNTSKVDLNQFPPDENITFTGFIDDVRPEIARSQLSIVPLRLGSGTRLKIIESMALGTPVVSTSKGAEGLAVTHGKNILIADDPLEFSEAVLAVMGSQDLRKRLSEAGLKLVSDKYNSENMGKKFNALLKFVTSSN
jgi:glycosyltransferase involved in cell wall biosynthesis